MNTPIQDLEDQIRGHYQQELGVPSPASDLWSKIADRLPAQEQPLSWRQRWFQPFALARAAIPALPRLTPARRLLVAGSLLCALLCVSGVVYGAISAVRTNPAPGAAISSADALLLAQLLQQNPKASVQQLALNQFTVHQTQTVESNTVMLQKILADANNVLLVYTIDGHTPLSLGSPDLFPTITLSDGQMLFPLFGEYKAQSSPKGADGRSVYPPVAALAYFPGLALEENPRQVTLHITIPIGRGASAHFTVTVPYYAAKIVSINQTVMLSGQALTLERVAITPSETRFYFKNGSPDPTNLMWRLSIAGKTYTVNAGAAPTGGEDYISFWQALQNKTGTWTLKASHFGSDDQTLAQFRFSVA